MQPNLMRNHLMLFEELKYMLSNTGLIEAFGLPREHGKSTINSFLFPLYSTLYNKSQFTLIISATEQIAVPFLDMIKSELEENESPSPIIEEKKQKSVKKQSSVLEEKRVQDDDTPDENPAILEPLYPEQKETKKPLVRLKNAQKVEILSEVAENTKRPLSVEIPMGAIINEESEESL